MKVQISALAVAAATLIFSAHAQQATHDPFGLRVRSTEFPAARSISYFARVLGASRYTRTLCA
jgi:hypothetical protein